MTLIPGFLKRGGEAALTPLVSLLIAGRVSPNFITTVGTLILVGGGVAFGTGMIRLGGALLLLSGIFDMLDGRVARVNEDASKFGAFYDSTLDRVGESVLFGGLAIYFVMGGVVESWRVIAVAVSIVALSAGLIISYARARAEGLGLECKVGIAQRAERILGLGAPVVFFGAGPRAWPPGSLLLGLVTLIAAAEVVTVIQRIVHVRKITRVARRHTQARWATGALAGVSKERTKR